MVSFSLEGILTKILVLDMYKALSIHKIRQEYRHYTRHYTYEITVTLGTASSTIQKPLLLDFFHAHNGLLTLHIEPTTGALTIYGKQAITGDLIIHGEQDPFLNSWVADPGGNILVRGPLLLQGGLYHIHVEIFTIDNDRSLFTPQQAPKFDAYLSVGSVYDKK